MERYLLPFMISVVAFCVGGLLANGWLNDVMSKKIEVAAPRNIEPDIPKTTFDCDRSGEACPIDSNGFAGGRCVGSDGSEIFVGRYEDTRTEAAANRAFERAVGAASRTISREPLFDAGGAEIGTRALIKINGKVRIVKLLRVSDKEFYSPFIVTVIEASDFRHVLEYENFQKEINRNARSTDF